MSKYSEKKKSVVFCALCIVNGRAVEAHTIRVIDNKPKWVCEVHRNG